MKEKIGVSSLVLNDFLTVRKKFPATQEYISACKFELPDFQRGYVWTKLHIERLIDDIFKKSGLYIGNIMTSNKVGGSDYLIDGQQRLVTISLLLVTLRGVAVSNELKNEINLLLKDVDEPRLVFSRNNLHQFYSDIVNDKKVIADDKAEEFIAKALKIIKRKIKSLGINSDLEIKKYLINIKNANFVLIKCFDPSEISNLFIGLNSTGIELSQVELVKSAIYGEIASLQNNTKLRKFNTTWRSIEKSYEKINIFWFNQFLRHQWFLVNGYVSGKKLADTIIKNKVKPHNVVELSDYLNKLKHDSKLYINIRNTTTNTKTHNLKFPMGTSYDKARKIPLVISDINKLELAQVYPVVLSLLNYGELEMSYHNRGRSLSDMEKLWSFLVLAKYSKTIPSQYEKKFAIFCFDVSSIKDYEDFKLKVSSFFKSLSALVELSKEVFVSQINERYSDRDGGFTKRMLYYTCDPTETLNIENLETEHILPQGSGSKGSFSKWKNIQKSEYDELSESLYRLGNLSLLEHNLNESAGNSSFTDKIKEYDKSEYYINHKIKNFINFNSKTPSDAVTERGEILAGEIFDALLLKLTNITK